VRPGARRLASAAVGVAAAGSAIWYFRDVALVTSGRPGGPLVVPAVLAASCTMLALYLWTSAKADD
jgi:hypothetical protein